MSMFRRRQGMTVSRHTVMIADIPVRYQRVDAIDSVDGKSEREPIVLVHGLSASTLWWRRNVESLARERTVYLVDLPGFGSMRRYATHFVLAQAGAWLVSWMDAVGLQCVDLIGHSMGGYICMWVAAHYPERVRRLVLVSPAVKSQVQSVRGYVIRLLMGIRYLTPRFFPILAFDALRTGPLTLLHAAQDILRLDVQQDIKAIAAHTLLVWGENDTLVPPTLAFILRGEIAYARLLMLKRAGHVSMFDQPHQFNKAVNAFLEGEVVGE